jgi:hypothetical protein
MPLIQSIHSHFYPVAWRLETLLLLFLEIVVNRKSGKGGREESLYLSGPEVAKSVRERCIRVAAIVIVISEGSRNICVAHKYEGYPYIATQRTYKVEWIWKAWQNLV